MPSAKAKHRQQGPRTFRGDRLKWMREQLKLTQEGLNDLVGLGPIQISRYEAGISEPMPEQLVKIAKALGCTADFLLGLSDDPESRYMPPELTRDEKLLILSWRSGRFLEMARDVLTEAIVKQSEPAKQTPDKGTD